MAVKVNKKVVSRATKKELVSQEKFMDFVQKKAYDLWQKEGQPQNVDFDIWIKAEKDVSEKYAVK